MRTNNSDIETRHFLSGGEGVLDTAIMIWGFLFSEVKYVLYEKGVLRRVSCWTSGISVVDD